MVTPLLIKTSEQEAMMAEAFIGQVATIYQDALRLAIKEIEATGEVTSFKSTVRQAREWSVWLPDGAGDVSNFIIFYSSLMSVTPRALQTSQRSLGINVSRGHAQGASVEFVEGVTHIAAHFSGSERDVLMELLHDAQNGKIHHDGRIEHTLDGVILRVPAKNQQEKKFAIELALVWKS